MGVGTSVTVLRTLRGVGACLLGAFVLWQVVERAVPPAGPTIVHVMEEDVDIFIDKAVYRVKGAQRGPIVTMLRRGRHTLRMSRRGEVLYEQPFEIGRNDDGIVLTAWDKGRTAQARKPPELAILPGESQRRRAPHAMSGVPVAPFEAASRGSIDQN